MYDDGVSHFIPSVAPPVTITAATESELDNLLAESKQSQAYIVNSNGDTLVVPATKPLRLNTETTTLVVVDPVWLNDPWYYGYSWYRPWFWDPWDYWYHPSIFRSPWYVTYGPTGTPGIVRSTGMALISTGTGTGGTAMVRASITALREVSGTGAVITTLLMPARTVPAEVPTVQKAAA